MLEFRKSAVPARPEFSRAKFLGAVALSLFAAAGTEAAQGRPGTLADLAPLSVFPFLGDPPPLPAAETREAAQPEPAAAGIRDNSFFIEEAYNQEAGVVQHISNAVMTWDDEDGVETVSFDFVFTQEWPLGSQAHQFSYTVPLSWFESEPDAGPREREGGIGDVLLNYRYQVADGSRSGFAFSPRFSAVLPTGDEDKGFGLGEFGFQLNLPASFECGSFAFHANAGVTAFDDVTAELPGGGTSPGRSLASYNVGASAIYVESPVVQPMLEAFAIFDEEIDGDGEVADLTRIVVSPGVRFAPYTSGVSQVVVGAAVPIGLSDDASDFGLFLYFSIEHPF